MKRTQERVVYQCDVCKRKSWYTIDSTSVGILPHCNITEKCSGIVRKVLSNDYIHTPYITPEVPEVEDWYPRKMLFTEEKQLNTVWKVTHKLGGLPNVYVFDVEVDENGVVITTPVNSDYYNITFTNGDHLEITFNNGDHQGVVQCVMTQSANREVQQFVPSADTIPVSTSDGEVTVAVLNDNPVTLTFVNNYSVNSYVPIEYYLTLSPSKQSAWFGVSRAFILGKQYTLYSFNLTQAATAAKYFEDGLVDQGAKIYVDYATHPDLLFLLSKPPHTVTDRIYDKYVDSKSIGVDNPQLILSGKSVVIDSDYVRSVYPRIYKIET